MVDSSQPSTVTVVVSLASRQVQQTPLIWTPGMTVANAVALALDSIQDPHLNSQWREGHLLMSVWGRRVRLDTVLQALDRLEFTRPLRVDPKIARRERFQKQGSRGTGLFSLKRK